MRLAQFPWRPSLRRRLVATYAIALLVATAAMAFLVVITFGLDTHALTAKGLRMQARWLEQGMQFDRAGRLSGLSAQGNAAWAYQSAPGDLKYRVLNASGGVLLASDPGGGPLALEGRPFNSNQPLFRTTIDGLPMYVLTVPWRRSQSTVYIQIARSARIDTLARRALVMPTLQVALWVEFGSLILFAIAVYIALSRTLTALRAASDAASRIEPNNLSQRLQIAGLPAEVQPLVDAFNLALGRLERGYRLQHEFLAGAAHELKTPLALIRAQLELDRETDQSTLLRDVDLMARQVHQLLHLAEVSEVHNYVLAPATLAAVAVEVVEHLRRLADRSEVSLRVLNRVGEAPRNMDRAAMFVLLKNLVENAIRHSPKGGIVIVTIEAEKVEVRDAGHGIREDDFPRLFTRFWRGAGRRDEGAGLGLAICREIAGVHGWRLEAANAHPGALFTLIFNPS